MKNPSTTHSSTMQEWLSFRNILSEKDKTEKPLLIKTEVPTRLIYHLAKQFAK